MNLTKDLDIEHLKNESEYHVTREMERQLSGFQSAICLCTECLADIAAMALNHVKPLYRYSLLGALYAQDAINDEAYAADIRRAVTDAIAKVKKNPSHPPADSSA